MPLRLLPEERGLGFTPYVWLIYLVFFPIEPFLRRMDVGWRVAALLVVPCFIALYLRSYWFSGRQLLPYVITMLALGMVFVPWIASANVFFVYASAFVGALGPPRVAVRYLLGIVAIALVEGYVLHLPAYAWLPASVVPLIVGGPNIHFMEAERSRRRLRLANDEIEHLAKVAERERIARDMHDLLGHTLSVIVLKSELAAKLSERDPERAAKEIKDVESVARQALSEVRRAIQGYRSEGLPAELRAVKPALDAASVTLHTTLQPVTLPPATEGVLALALREAVTNVVRHSGARNCWVELRAERDAVSLEVRDDGRGGTQPLGSGLLGMRERARALGGDIEREDDGGMRLRVRLPLGHPPALPATAC